MKNTLYYGDNLDILGQDTLQHLEVMSKKGGKEPSFIRSTDEMKSNHAGGDSQKGGVRVG